MSFKNFLNGSANPFGGLYKTLIKVFLFLSHQSSIESDFTSMLFILRSGRSLSNFLYKLKPHLLFHNF